ncbi:MAG: hypothetical protein AB8B80_09750 [Marinicellaceae bacterium]
MNKYLILLILASYNLFAMTIVPGSINEISKENIKIIIEEAKKLGIKETTEIKTIRSWLNRNHKEEKYKESIAIVFKPHIEAKFHAINHQLSCEKLLTESWKCENKEQLYLRFDENQEYTIFSENKESTQIETLVEVARAANNLRPMSWRQTISGVYQKHQSLFRVTFGSYASCFYAINIIREYNGKSNLYSVDWEKVENSGCAQIAGFIDTNKRYVVYENEKWISEK